MSETARIADQLRRAFEGDAWHGDSLLQILDGVTAAQAAAHPAKDAHSIWELVKHIEVWDRAVRKRLAGEATQPTGKKNFPTIEDDSEPSWKQAVSDLAQGHHELVAAVEAFPDSRLHERVPGKDGEPAYYNFYYMLNGLTQHEVYHAGQIALLKKMV